MLFVVNVSPSPLLSCTESVPVRPATATLKVKFTGFVVHVAVTVVFAVIVPLALLLSVQVCPEGCVFTVTA
jgi:hypothetical protein